MERGLLPFPEPKDPPGDVSDERRKEILADPRVQNTIERDQAIRNTEATKPSVGRAKEPASV